MRAQATRGVLVGAEGGGHRTRAQRGVGAPAELAGEEGAERPGGVHLSTREGDLKLRAEISLQTWTLEASATPASGGNHAESEERLASPEEASVLGTPGCKARQGKETEGRPAAVGPQGPQEGRLSQGERAARERSEHGAQKRARPRIQPRHRGGVAGVPEMSGGHERTRDLTWTL